MSSNVIAFNEHQPREVCRGGGTQCVFASADGGDGTAGRLQAEGHAEVDDRCT